MIYEKGDVKNKTQTAFYYVVYMFIFLVEGGVEVTVWNKLILELVKDFIDHLSFPGYKILVV